MEIRLAVSGDLSRLRAFYLDVVRQMEAQQLFLWDEIYPCCALEEDIAHARLHLLLENGRLLAAFALSPSHDGWDQISWQEPQAPACYLDRLAVSPRCQRQGLGLETLRQAAALAQAQNARFLRLFAANENIPAIRLYQKAGFRQGTGIYEEVIDQDLVIRQLGFELFL